MNLVIFGAGSAGQFLVDEIMEKRKDIKISCILDNKISGCYRKIKISRPDEYFDKIQYFPDAFFIAAGAQKTVKLMIDTIRQYCDSDIYMLHDIAGKNRISPFDDLRNINKRYLRKIRFSKEKPTLPYVEVPVTDLCNLNCKGCLFACNAMAGNNHINKDQIVRDAVRMKELFEDIPWIRILGGEPLMHPDIIEIMDRFRNIYTDSEIDLCTNGLLIPKMPDIFFESLRKNKITLHISGYKPTYYMLDAIDAKLKKEKIIYSILKRDTFLKYYTIAPDNSENKNFLNCIASGCRELYQGRLIRCSAVIAFEN